MKGSAIPAQGQRGGSGGWCGNRRGVWRRRHRTRERPAGTSDCCPREGT